MNFLSFFLSRRSVWGENTLSARHIIMFGFCPVCFSSEAALNATTMASVRGGDTGSGGGKSGVSILIVGAGRLGTWLAVKFAKNQKDAGGESREEDREGVSERLGTTETSWW